MSGTPVARPAAFHLSLAALDLPWSDAGRSNEDRVGFGLDADAVVCVWDRCAPPRLTLSRLNDDDPTGWPGAANILGGEDPPTCDDGGVGPLALPRCDGNPGGAVRVDVPWTRASMPTPVDSASWYLRRDAVDSPSSSSPSLSDGPGSIDGPFFEGGMIDRRHGLPSPPHWGCPSRPVALGFSALPIWRSPTLFQLKVAFSD